MSVPYPHVLFEEADPKTKAEPSSPQSKTPTSKSPQSKSPQSKLGRLALPSRKSSSSVRKAIKSLLTPTRSEWTSPNDTGKSDDYFGSPLAPVDTEAEDHPPVTPATIKGSTRDRDVKQAEANAVAFGGSLSDSSLVTSRQATIRRETWDGDWFVHRIDQTLQDGEGDDIRFQWDLPMHLPTSPLCPMNPKYRGPARMCVYHGRKKTEDFAEISDDET
jgi:hypothetical protein